MPLPPTRELANQYRVSLSTVHNVLRQLEAEQLIECRPRQGSFVRKPSPGNVSSKRVGQHVLVIGVNWKPDIPHESWSGTLLGEMNEAISTAGWQMTVVPSTDHATCTTSPEQALIEQVDRFEGDVAGIICFGPMTGLTALTEELDARNLPWIVINRPGPRSVHNFVASDHRDIGRKAGRCLTEMGLHRVLAVTNGVQVWNSNLQKLSGLMEAFVQAGAPVSGITHLTASQASENAGYEQAVQFLDAHGVPDAIFASGDYLALGAIRALTERDIAVPEQVGVIGSTGLNVGSYTSPALTVVAQPMRQVGRHAVSMLLEMASEGTRRMVGRELPGQFVWRQSLAVPEALRVQLESNAEDDVQAACT